MKDLGEASYILGIRIYRDRSRGLLGLSQSTYIDKLLKWFSSLSMYVDCERPSNPLDLSL